MYYSAIAQANTNRHCIGVALADSSSPAGPYVPTSTSPLACPLDQGGAIDASAFRDADGTRYVLYKIDGNSVGHGGDCNNSQEPLVATPIMIQQVAEDGLTAVGDAVQLIDRDEADGPLVEAPSLVRSDDGTYLLFYSTHCFTDVKYDVRYATASSVTGPYAKTGNSLLASNGELYGPGGATVQDNGNVLFHGWCNGNTVRCMYAAHLGIDGHTVTVE
jgi:beta-xylosidase